MSKTVKVNMRRSMRYLGVSYGPGEGIEVPEAFAVSQMMTIAAEKPNTDPLREGAGLDADTGLPTGEAGATAPAPTTGTATGEEIEASRTAEQKAADDTARATAKAEQANAQRTAKAAGETERATRKAAKKGTTDRASRAKPGR